MTMRGAEMIIGLFTKNLIHRRPLWVIKEAVEFPALRWASCLNKHRVRTPIGLILPAAAEEFYSRLLANLSAVLAPDFTQLPLRESLYGSQVGA